jgi:GDP-4-dehydro-6-deoxy-D-mannose reductase
LAVPLQDALALLVGASSAAISVVRDPARMRAVDTPLLCGDATRLRSATGWEPRYELAETLADLLEAARRSVIGDTPRR